MTEKIDSKAVIKPNSVEAHIPSKFEIFISHFPDIAKVVFAIGAAGTVLGFCIYAFFSTDPELRQFKHMAMTAVIGIGTGALGFLYGASKKG